MKALYKYPQDEFPYKKLEEENLQRTVYDREYELLDTGRTAVGVQIILSPCYRGDNFWRQAVASLLSVLLLN